MMRYSFVSCCVHMCICMHIPMFICGRTSVGELVEAKGQAWVPDAIHCAF